MTTDYIKYTILLMFMMFPRHDDLIQWIQRFPLQTTEDMHIKNWYIQRVDIKKKKSSKPWQCPL